MNIAVINLKDIIKYTMFFGIIIVFFWTCTNIFKGEELKNELEKAENSFFYEIKNSSLLECLKTGLPLIRNYDVKKETNKTTTAKKILYSQIVLIKNIEEKEKLSENLLEELENNDKEEDNTFIENNENKSEKAETEIILENNINAKYTDTAQTVQINNQTNYDIQEIIDNPNYEIKNKEKIIIYHTHTCESYTSSDAFSYEMTGVYRTTDLNYTVARVGDELEKLLTGYGKNIIHDKTYHDYPAYNGSYGRSLKTMENVLKDNRDAEILIDLHRDAVGSNNNYGPTVKIGDEICAQVMFVIGSDGSGLYHPNWKENLKFAITIQQKANEMYPGLFRPIILRNSRYNQHLTTATTIIEVGATRKYNG